MLDIYSYFFVTNNSIGSAAARSHSVAGISINRLRIWENRYRLIKGRDSEDIYLVEEIKSYDKRNRDFSVRFVAVA
jgi:hypothetical protein